MMNDGLRTKALQKLLEFMQSLPDSEGESLEGEPAAHEAGETPMVEGGEHPRGKIEIMAMEAKPAPKGDLADEMKNKIGMKGC